MPPYNVYGGDGDVTAELVYANYGMRDDYEELERNGISVKGAIVITRYGGGWRGLKPKLAYEHGAIGCIIYSDPADDGYGQGDVLPKGPMRPPFGVQRGSVADNPLYAGDPLTPGWGSVPGAKRLAIKDAPSIMKIPVLPIGYGAVSDAEATCPNHQCPKNTDPSLIDKGNTGRIQAGVGWGMLGVGIAAVGGGMVWQFLLNKPRAENAQKTGLWVAPVAGGGTTGMTVGGSF